LLSHPYIYVVVRFDFVHSHSFMLSFQLLPTISFMLLLTWVRFLLHCPFQVLVRFPVIHCMSLFSSFFFVILFCYEVLIDVLPQVRLISSSKVCVLFVIALHVLLWFNFYDFVVIVFWFCVLLVFLCFDFVFFVPCYSRFLCYWAQRFVLCFWLFCMFWFCSILLISLFCFWSYVILGLNWLYFQLFLQVCWLSSIRFSDFGSWCCLYQLIVDICVFFLCDFLCLWFWVCVWVVKQSVEKLK